LTVSGFGGAGVVSGELRGAAAADFFVELGQLPANRRRPLGIAACE
jgi:hypothetical protein